MDISVLSRRPRLNRNNDPIIYSAEGKYILLNQVKVEEAKWGYFLHGLGQKRKAHLCYILKIMFNPISRETVIHFKYTNKYGNEEEWSTNANHLTVVRPDGSY